MSTVLIQWGHELYCENCGSTNVARRAKAASGGAEPDSLAEVVSAYGHEEDLDIEESGIIVEEEEADMGPQENAIEVTELEEENAIEVTELEEENPILVSDYVDDGWGLGEIQGEDPFRPLNYECPGCGYDSTECECGSYDDETCADCGYHYDDCECDS